ncbi:ATP-binding protein [Flavivirga jejuensis]|uniref:ATP-binding protein n=1 Tax=Flavivirga jejuensis TaxID=870487 RepID=A0ABT8WRF7_9FLAO|nr:ATP-binding protein [Flavivirga jejuensis]MDO5975610.1 ATP-binding protein [Flavivirga jejuensis]
MSKLTVNVPLRANPIRWIEFVNRTRSIDLSDKDILEFNLRTSAFIKPAELVLIACLIEELKLKYEITVTFVNGSFGLNSHLDNIKFKRYWDHNFNRDNYTDCNNYSTLGLWKISQNIIDVYGRVAQSYFRKAYLPDKDLLMLSSNLVEVFNNVFNHSHSLISGYVLTQFFPQLCSIKFSVCDFGVGIPHSVNKFLSSKGGDTLDDCSAIIKSLERGFSIRSIPQNAGFGLSNVLDFTENCNGTLTIISNQGFVQKSAGEDFFRSNLDYFHGTLIQVEIDTNCLDEFDTDDEVYEF